MVLTGLAGFGYLIQATFRKRLVSIPVSTREGAE
jgi:hypothetical protein